MPKIARIKGFKAYGLTANPPCLMSEGKVQLFLQIMAHCRTTSKVHYDSICSSCISTFIFDAISTKKDVS